MRTDISKINEQTPHQELTEGLMLFGAGTSKQFNTGEWRTNTPAFLNGLQTNANSAFFAHLFVRTELFR